MLSTELGIASLFPLFCFIVWNDKLLGSIPRWPSLTYIIEGRVQETGLVATPSYIAGTNPVDEGDPIDVVDVVNGGQGTGKFRLNGLHTDRLEIGETFDVSGNTADGTYTIFKVETLDGGFGIPPITDVYPTGGLTGADANGTVQPKEAQNDDGVNLAHVIWEMLFAQPPYGLALEQSEWDIQSLEDLGTLRSGSARRVPRASSTQVRPRSRLPPSNECPRLPRRSHVTLDRLRFGHFLGHPDPPMARKPPHDVT